MYRMPRCIFLTPGKKYLQGRLLWFVAKTCCKFDGLPPPRSQSHAFFFCPPQRCWAPHNHPQAKEKVESVNRHAQDTHARMANSKSRPSCSCNHKETRSSEKHVTASGISFFLCL
ncbi:unnamed protein product, partial [Ectocarpus fasciculatus]